MTKFYAEFGLEVFDNSIINAVIKTMQQLGKLRITNTKVKTVIIDFRTPEREVISLEEVSNELCDVIIPFKEQIKDLLFKYKEKIYCDICFVKMSEECDCSFDINTKIIHLASYLDVPIIFDGFQWYVKEI